MKKPTENREYLVLAKWYVYDFFSTLHLSEHAKSLLLHYLGLYVVQPLHDLTQFWPLWWCVLHNGTPQPEQKV